MSPNGGGAVSRPRSKRRFQRALQAVIAVLLAIVAVSYLSGYFLLWSLKLPPRKASPLTAARYAYYYGDRAWIRRRLLVCSASSAVMVAASVAASCWPPKRKLHGDARFAHRDEIAAAGLLGDQGILLGELGGRYLLLPGQQGISLAAPPRSGKGVSIVVPNCLNWPGSLICNDVKLENYRLTAGYRRAAGQAVFLFDPLNEERRTARWNPFTYVSETAALRINDLQRIAAMLYPEVPGTDPFWVASARSLFLGIALYLFETPSALKTIGEVLRQGMASDDEGFGKHWRRIIEGRRSGRYPLSPECVRALYDIIDLAPVTASSVRKTFTSRLDLWQNPILDSATSASDFDLRDLRRKPMSIYVGVNPDDIHRLRPVLSLFFEQAIGLQTRTLPEHDPKLTYQLLLMLDEVAAMGRIPILAESISYLPGYNVRVALIFHALSQLREVYGVENAKTMTKSLGARIVFSPRDYDDSKEISDDLGNTTVRVRSKSRPLSFGLSGQRSRQASVTVSEQRRPLLLPQEVRELGPRKAIIFVEGLRPILARKVCYYRDRRFRSRLRSPPIQQIAPESVFRQAPVSHHAGTGVEAAQPKTRMTEEPVIDQTTELASLRQPTVADLPNLASLTLDDFAGRYDHVEVSQDRPATADELQRAVDQFLSGLTAG